MIKRENGFSLIEMMIAVGIVSIILASAVTFFTLSVKQYKTQTKITASGLEGIIGLEMLRRDLENIGFGLPWNNVSFPYIEISSGQAELLARNDSGNPPRAIVGIDNATFTVNRSDYFAIKSLKVGIHPAAGKWTHLNYWGNKRIWTPPSENLDNTDWVIVLKVGGTEANRRSLIRPNIYIRYDGVGGNIMDYTPEDSFSMNVMYGLGGDIPTRPFNRADYFIANAANNGIDVPLRCAPGTGVLVKGILPHNLLGGAMTLLPLLDCVADMEVVYGIDTNGDRMIDTWGDWNSTLGTIPAGPMAAALIRERLMEVRVSILAHEGQRDDSFMYADNAVFVGTIAEMPPGVQRSFGRHYDVSTQKNYRWKVYNLAVQPLSLAQ